MNRYVTGAIIKKLREEKGLTQSELAQKLNVSNKAISKWETAKGYPDITLIEPLAQNLGVSVMELLSGNDITNGNRSFNMLRTKIYVCPVCGNVIFATGDTAISCCGINLIALEAEETDEEHSLSIERVEDEYFVTVEHEMTKEHFISFIAEMSDDGVQLVKLYPEGNAQTRLKLRRAKYVYFYCNRHGLFRVKVKR